MKKTALGVILVAIFVSFYAFSTEKHSKVTKGKVRFQLASIQIMADLETGIVGRCEVSANGITVVFFSPCMVAKLPDSKNVYYFVFDSNNDMEFFSNPRIMVRTINNEEIELLYLRDAI